MLAFGNHRDDYFGFVLILTIASFIRTAIKTNLPTLTLYAV